VIKKTSRKKSGGSFWVDKAIYIVGIGGVFVFLPQLLKVWDSKNVAGLSLVSWVGMAIGSLIWVAYGLIHKQKPIIFINISLAIMQGLIVLGIILYS
jgi:uncharacterized protein with PQ loop repeat